MRSETDIKAIKKALQTICEHPLFVNSSVYTRLLTYLVEKAIAGEDIKEFTIGADLFGKNYSGDKNDGSVRTYMYKLRKKLAAYYAEKETEDEVIFEIKKGQYNLNFIGKKEYIQAKNLHEIRIPTKQIKQVGAVLFILLTLVLVFRTYQNQPPSIWKSFMKRNADNLLIISDQYMLMYTNEFGEKHATMYREINSDQDLFQYKESHPNRKVDKTDFTVMTKMAPFATKSLYDWFQRYHKDFSLQLESKLSYDEIRENNIVFIGQFKTMSTSKSLFLSNSAAFSIYDDGYKYEKDGETKVYNTIFSSDKKVEYAMVSYTSFHPDKKALYFVSNNDVGVLATLRNFTDPEFLKTFTKKLPTSDTPFNALFKVTGIDRTDVSCELVELETLMP